jgi:hypothetical protein
MENRLNVACCSRESPGERDPDALVVEPKLAGESAWERRVCGVLVPLEDSPARLFWARRCSRSWTKAV